MKADFPEYFDALRLVKELDEAFKGNPSGWLGINPEWEDAVERWTRANTKAFIRAFKSLVPKLEFFCRDYAVPLRDAYCLFKLDDGQAFRHIFSHDGKRLKIDPLIQFEFFYFLHDSLEYSHRTDKLPETEFHRVVREMLKKEED